MQNKTENAVAGSLEQDNAAMQQIRNLLFGRQVEEIQKNLREQREFFLQELNNTRAEWLSRFQAFEKDMQNEHAAIYKELRREQEERESVVQSEQRERTERMEAASAEQDVQRDMLKTELRAELENLKLEHGEELDALRDGLREMAKELSRIVKELMAADKTNENKLLAELEACRRKILALISSTAGELRHELVSRAALSGIFSANIHTLGDNAQKTATPDEGNAPEAVNQTGGDKQP
ncbi:MAG: hypothetical protein LBM00_04685 [Deltaproteobacteria bacterium]|jgi:hypothetical protein|nr:hypothetical protein [Deltaproteobacteria bacterium]